MTDLWFVYHG